MKLHWLRPDAPADEFPDVDLALTEPPGLLAAGGDLRPERLLAGYRRGIFPWYEDGEPILWWSPEPRAVLPTREVHVSRRLRRTLRRADLRISVDEDFAGVVAGCAAPRAGQSGTWITPAMQAAYGELHRRGDAHSLEVWQDDRLVGGIYGVGVGRAFFGESMFGTIDNASKIALVSLARRLDAWRIPLIDCQMPTPHLASMGARLMPRREFVATIGRLCAAAPASAAWDEFRS